MMHLDIHWSKTYDDALDHLMGSIFFLHNIRLLSFVS